MRSPTPPRGAALLLVIVSIAVVTALSVDLAYETRVSLQTAANARDELRATALAKSAVNVSRLVLHFQQQLGAAGAAAGALAGALPGAAPPAGAKPGAAPVVPAAAAAGAQQGLAAGLGALTGLRLWELVPVDSTVIPLLLGGGRGGGAPAPAENPAPAPGRAAGGAAAADAPPARSFGDFDGSFRAKIEDEERKVNVRQLNGLGALPAAQAARLAELIKDPKYDFLFDQDDANGLRVSRRDLFAALKDWTDEDEVSSTFTGVPAQPFEQGYGDENALYQRLPDRYVAKNAWFDSVDELYMVAGVSDAFMAAFGDHLTVYPDVNAGINVNAATRAELVLNALVMSDPPGIPQPALLDPAFGDKLDAALALARPLPFMSMTPQGFAQILTALGVKVKAEYLQAKNTDSRAAFTDRSSTFRIRATGTAGDVKKDIQAVVVFDGRAGPLAQDLGRVIHWHEE